MKRNTVITTFTIPDVMKALERMRCGRILVHNYPVGVTDTLRMFREKGTKCDLCGVEGEAFELLVDLRSNSLYLELIAMRGDRKVKFTKDHTIPKHVGGKNCSSNYVTMCHICNNEWKCIFDLEYKDKIACVSEKGDEALIFCT